MLFRFLFRFRSDLVRDLKPSGIGLYGALTPIPVKFPPWWQNMDFMIMQMKIQNPYPIRNFTLDHFVLRDRFHIPNGFRDLWVQTGSEAMIEIVNLPIQLVTEKKIIQVKFLIG